MRKIYSAINKTEFHKSITKSMFDRYFPDSEIAFISKEECSTIFRGSFHMLIAPKDYIDLDTLNNNPSMGTIVLIGTPLDQIYATNDFVLLYPDLEQFARNLLTKDLVNQSIQNTKPNQIGPVKPINQEEKGSFSNVSTHENEEKQQEFNEEVATNMKTEHPPEQNLPNQSWKEEEEPNFSKPVDMEDFPPKISITMEYLEFSRIKEIINANYTYGKWDKNKVIGVWSPIVASGVTTLIINLAIYLKQQYDLNVAVLEALTKRSRMKSLLSMYGQIPEGWNNFSEVISNPELTPSSLKWQFRGVDWLPLGTSDLEAKWSSETVGAQLSLIKNANISLVDLPSEKMEPYTLASLHHLDELWILLDHRLDLSGEWTNYMTDLIGHYSLNVKLLVLCSNKKLTDIIVKHFGIYPLLSVISPSVPEVVEKAYLQNKPLIDEKDAKKSLLPGFEDLVSHLLGPDRELYNSNFWKKLKKRFLYTVDFF